MKPLVNDPDPVDLQFLFSPLSLSIIVSSAVGADFEFNPQIKDIMCRVRGEVLDATPSILAKRCARFGRSTDKRVCRSG